MKAGVHTSEFWMTLVVVICSFVLLLNGDITSEDWKIVGVGAAASYTAGRSYIKSRNSSPS